MWRKKSVTPTGDEPLGCARDDGRGNRFMWHAFVAFNATISRWCMYVAVAGLVGIVATVALQVFGRYVLNDTPTWAESLALVLILYVTMLGAAVGVRDAGHIGLESLLILAPDG